MNKKVAFFTMDVESFYDTSCIRAKNISSDERYDCAICVKQFLNFLNQRKIKATLFLTVSFLPRCKEVIKQAIEDGHEIALHCLNHDVVTSQDLDEFEGDILIAKQIIKKELGIDVKGFRFPCFHFNNDYLKIIKKNGFLYDSSSVGKVGKSYIKVNDVVSYQDEFYEFSPIRKDVLNISGGGWLRLYPWPGVYRRLKSYIKKHDAYLFYLHPFEISTIDLPDYKQLTPLKRMFVKRGRKTYLDKIDTVIELLNEEGYSFSTMSDYIDNIE